MDWRLVVIFGFIFVGFIAFLLNDVSLPADYPVDKRDLKK